MTPCVHVRVLADVHGGQVEAEGGDRAAEPPQAPVGDHLAAVGAQARVDDVQLRGEGPRVRSRARRCPTAVRCSRLRPIAVAVAASRAKTPVRARR